MTPRPTLTLNLAPNPLPNLNRTLNLTRAFSLLFLLFLLPLSGCDSQSTKSARVMVGGDPTHGQSAINYYGCAACHTIPGIHGASALVGPPLTQFGSRTYVAGMLQNTPDNLVRWIQDPPAINPHTAMPNLHVTPTDARDIATYLYTLQ